MFTRNLNSDKEMLDIFNSITDFLIKFKSIYESGTFIISEKTIPTCINKYLQFNENRIDLDIYKIYIPLEFNNPKSKIENNITKLSYKEDEYSYIKIGIPKDKYLKYLFLLHEDKLVSFEKLIIEDFESKNINYLNNLYFEEVINTFKNIILNEYKSLRSQFYKINDSYINSKFNKLQMFIHKNFDSLNHDTICNENDIIFSKLLIYIKDEDYNIEKLEKFHDILPIKYSSIGNVPYIVIYCMNTILFLNNDLKDLKDLLKYQNEISSNDKLLSILNKVIIDDYIKSKSNIISGNYDDKDIQLIVFREKTFDNIDPTDIESKSVLKAWIKKSNDKLTFDLFEYVNNEFPNILKDDNILLRFIKDLDLSLLSIINRKYLNIEETLFIEDSIILKYYLKKDYVHNLEILYYILKSNNINVDNTICRTMRFFTLDIDNNYKKLRSSFIMNNEKFRKTIICTLKDFNRDDLIFNLCRRFKI